MVDREGQRLEFQITPKFVEEREAYLIGVTRAEDMVQKRFGFFSSIKQGVMKAVDMIVQVVGIIKGLVFGQYSIKTLGGPFMIAQVAGQAAESGVVAVIGLMAFLSLQLGLINLFPIPVLDGGHLVFFGIEWVRGKPLGERAIGATQQVGFAFADSLDGICFL